MAVSSLELIILIGLQASGKSSFYKSHFVDTHVRVSKDLLRNNSRPARRRYRPVDRWSWIIRMFGWKIARN